MAAARQPSRNAAMTASIAVVILAHNNPAHVRRMTQALTGLDIFLHCDSKTSNGVLEMMTAGAPDIVLSPRYRTARASWGMLEGELAGIRIALERSRAEHIVVASGSCYPLVSVADLQDELASWRGLSRLELSPIPYHAWSFRSGEPDGGLWRFNRRFLTIRGSMLLVYRGYPIPVGRREIPPMLSLHASSQWKIYAREHAQTLLRVLDEHPDLVRFWRGTFAVEESCVASILSSRELVGSVVDELRHDRTWYIDWRGKEVGGHPRWLDIGDFPRLKIERNLPPLQPDDDRARGDTSRKLFARKFGVGSDDLLDLIDRELRI
jgi:hypothetical protein